MNSFGSSPANTMQDMICVITGATSGLGKAIALLMAHRGATLVVPCRNAQKGQQLVHEVQRATQRATVDIVPADLSSQQSIRQFVARFRSRYARLDILVNNAALITPERTTTVDGLETQFAVNHLAPFLLTNLLLDSLASSPAARIINVASNSYKAGWIDFDDLQSEKNYQPKVVYASTKRANILFTYALAQKLDGAHIPCNCFHPGRLATKMLGEYDYGHRNRWVRAVLLKLKNPAPKTGAALGMRLATEPALARVSGKYFDSEGSHDIASLIGDLSLAERLWSCSAQYVGLT